MTAYSIGELAKRSGITVRALRYYETQGLLAPLRTESGQRVYGTRDILRLQQIQMLKQAGFSLAQIKTMMAEQAVDAARLLGMQQELLQARLAETDAMLETVTSALRAVREGQTVDLSTLCSIIKQGESAMSEEKWQKVWDTYYTAEEQERWKAAKEAVPEDVQKACERNWPTLIARTEALVGTDPAAPEAQAIVKEWNAMTQVIYDVDPSLMRSAARMYDDMDNWPKDGPVSPFSKEVWDFIKAAEAAAES
ncbi:MerR family transcriptional regulator [Kordiimonas lacus]|uniref:DNA-binding transcriptional regulator, MerR family n=1 Tax=Kordiimonas lacus TaxID=637679 RepID=A0A1G6U2A1_9PROT|nr:MerR family transcriptional regulator [Kordiimonas lacus]SDD35433.1 DNA-binding transcriptional regulator, MerR family [Kordiimonas lacus]